MSDEPRSPAAIREARLRSALRDNLRRRKAQARDRGEARPDITVPTSEPRGGGDRDG